MCQHIGNNREQVTIETLTGERLILAKLVLQWVTHNKAFVYILVLQLQQNSNFLRFLAELQIHVSAG